METLDIENFEKLKLAAQRLFQSGLKVFFLKGDLGAGKTTFVSYFIKENLLEKSESLESLGVMSPTFSLINIYKTNKFSILHADLYRVKEHDFELEEILSSIDEVDFAFVEWPERLGDLSDVFDIKELTFKLDSEKNVRKIIC